MAELPAETCMWKYHDKNKWVELIAFCFLINFKQIDARNAEYIKWNMEVYKPFE